jgi:hypothetical protein
VTQASEVELSSPALRVLDDLKDAPKPEDHYRPEVVEELQKLGFVREFPNQKVGITSSGLDYLMPPGKPRPYVPPVQRTNGAAAPTPPRCGSTGSNATPPRKETARTSSWQQEQGEQSADSARPSAGRKSPGSTSQARRAARAGTCANHARNYRSPHLYRRLRDVLQSPRPGLLDGAQPGHQRHGAALCGVRPRPAAARSRSAAPQSAGIGATP